MIAAHDESRKSRTKKDEYFMGFAIQSAKASKCPKAQYGAVVVDKNGRIVATGYNH